MKRKIYRFRSSGTQTIITAIVIFVGLAAIFYIFNFKENRIKRQIDSNAGETYGIIYNIEKRESMTHGFNGTTVSVKYITFVKYRVEGKEYTLNKSFDYMPKSDSILVRFDQADPGKSYTVNQSNF